jgi:ParB-like chromosome segregation protein Spo0J
VDATGNVRTTPTDDEATKQLAAPIQGVGLLQSLVVQQSPHGKYAVVAGDRRFNALTLLCAEGQISQTYKVLCRLLPSDADLTEISLAGNIGRESMIGCVLNLSSFPQLRNGVQITFLVEVVACAEGASGFWCFEFGKRE